MDFQVTTLSRITCEKSKNANPSSAVRGQGRGSECQRLAGDGVWVGGCARWLLDTDGVFMTFYDLLSIGCRRRRLSFLFVIELLWFIRLCASRAWGDCAQEQVWTGRVRITVSDDTQLTGDKHSRWNWNLSFICLVVKALTISLMYF